VKKEPNWNAFKKATGTELEVILLKQRVKQLEEKLEKLIYEQEKQKETNSGSSKV
jgi:predicted ATP-grasp superfamily ATP-dependent carboligase